MNKIRCVKIERPDCSPGASCICRIEHSLVDEFEGAESGEQILVTYCELTKEEYDALPEFAGW
jgi:hypothetical protein